MQGKPLHRLTTLAFSFQLIFSAAAVSAAEPANGLVRESSLRAHLAFLSDDLLEGRGTGQRGGDLAVAYLNTQAGLIGLQPLPSKQLQGYLQKVSLTGSRTLPDSYAEYLVGGQKFALANGSEIVFGGSGGHTDTSLNAPVVFVGYGVKAPEHHWDDYKGADLKGKLLIMMVNDPQPTAEEPQRFDGAALTYYGRWTYKFEEAARQGAAGVLLIHTDQSASYGWNVPRTSFSHERFSLPGMGNPFEGWIQNETARKLFAAAGQDLDQLRAAAERRDFKPVELALSLHAELHSAVRKVDQYNVIGMVPGTDPELRKQAVIYSAHWDHLGIETDAAGQTHIFNGAVDNASGSAALLAMAQAAVARPTRRSQIFFWPCAEEQYLLGSAAYVANPPWPLAATAADLNLDSMNFVTTTRDIGVAGAERSSLYQTARQVAAGMGLKIAPAVPDLGGAYFRADHFNFARAGVPAFNVGSAVFSGDGHFDFDKQPEARYQAQMKGFKSQYHTEQDRYSPDWDLSGMVQQAQFTLNLGRAVANQTAMPVWRKGEAFGQIRR